MPNVNPHLIAPKHEVSEMSHRFQVLKAAQLDAAPPEHPWLIGSIWSREAVGIISGPPKSAKTWAGIELAISVASKCPAFGCYPVQQHGPALIYLAEDSPTILRARIEAICLHRQLDIQTLDLHVIVTPTLRLDVDADRQRLYQTIDRIRPVFLLLDPLVRLHALDENRAGDMAGLLGFLRNLQRTFHLAVALTHHQSKRQHAQPGKALRGSSDLWAWTDSAAYLSRRKDHIVLTLEHRAAPAPDPIRLNLISRTDGTGTHLEVLEPEAGLALPDKILTLLRQSSGPLSRVAIRKELRVRNQTLGQALESLEHRGQILSQKGGWIARCSSERNTLANP
jgi:hypothetical protein